MNQDLLNRGIFDVPDDLVLCVKEYAQTKCLQLKYQGNITYLVLFPSQGDFRWVKTGLGALRKLGNRCWKSAGEQLMFGLVISKTETARTGPKNR